MNVIHRRVRRKLASASFVYVLFCEEQGGLTHVKIGKANDPAKRMRAYMTHCPIPVRSLYSAPAGDEYAAYTKEHELLSALCHFDRKGEWLTLRTGAQVEELFDTAQRVLGAELRRTDFRDPAKTLQFRGSF
jgi:hypothetical protein